MRLRLMGLVLACAVVFGATAASAAALSFSFPAQLGFLAGDDWEPAIAADRFGHVYALWTHYGGDPLCDGCASPHMELQVSSDGGATWSTPRPLTPGTQLRQDDPQIVVDPADGRTLYAAYMLGDKASQYVAKSTDFGQTWTNVLVESLQRGTDKDILAVRGQDVYLVYNAVQKIWASVSHDAGKTWTLNHVIGNTNSKFGWSLPGGGAVDSKGIAYFAWEGFTANGKPSGPVNLFITKSTDGGETWTSHLVDVSQAPPQCGTCGWAYWGPQTTLAVDSRDRLYVLYNANRIKFGVNRMLFARSTDGALTWDRRQDVSGAPIGSNNLFPAIAARGNADVRIAWQDDRNGFDAGNDDPNARWNTYYRSSTNGGTTWSSEAQLSRFVAGYAYKFAAPQEGFGEPYGDYLELDIDGSGVTHAIWGEAPSYAGPGNVWYARGQ